MPKTYAVGEELPAADMNGIVQTSGSYATDSGGDDTYAITVTPVPTTYTDGDEYTFKPTTANTGACTLNVNGLGAKSIKKYVNGSKREMQTGDIVATMPCRVKYDGTDFIFLSKTGRDVTEINTKTTTAAGATLQHSNDSMQSTTNTVYTKVKEILLNQATGGLRIEFKVLDNAADGYGKIYKNGVAIGTERHVFNTNNTYQEDFAGPFAVGDLIQIYAKQSGGGQVEISNFRLYFTPTLTQILDMILATPLTLTNYWVDSPTNNL